MKTYQDLIKHFEGTEVADKLKQIEPEPWGGVTLANVLDNSFDWCETAEGADYWYKIYQQLQDEESQNVLVGGSGILVSTPDQSYTLTRFTDDELRDMCKEMIYQITGDNIPEDEQCEVQGHPDWQTAMYYFRLLNGE